MNWVVHPSLSSHATSNTIMNLAESESLAPECNANRAAFHSIYHADHVYFTHIPMVSGSYNTHGSQTV